MSFRGHGAYPEELVYDERTGSWEPVVREPEPHRFPTAHVILFLLTVASTVFRGGALYSAGLIAILLTHEMGHYILARMNRVPATLPYFIPFPLNFFGTLGAVIRMDGRRATRRQLFDIGIAGPIAGIVVALPMAWYGLSRSEVLDPAVMPPMVEILGRSPLFQWLISSALGESVPAGSLLLHPLAQAGWVGLFVTALNLLPLGQLDGGHILYGIFGPRSDRIAGFVLVGLGVLIVLFRSWSYVPLLLLIYWIGFKHPAAPEAHVGLDGRRKLLGIVMLLFFLVAFTPVPVRFS